MNDIENISIFFGVLVLGFVYANLLGIVLFGDIRSFELWRKDLTVFGNVIRLPLVSADKVSYEVAKAILSIFVRKDEEQR